MLVEKLCREEEVGFVDLWGNFVGWASSKWKRGQQYCGCGLSAAVDSGMGSI